MRCPICQREFKPADSDAPPFCSERCRTIDLGKWLGEEYGMPDIPDPEADETPDHPWDDDQPREDVDAESVDG